MNHAPDPDLFGVCTICREVHPAGGSLEEARQQILAGRDDGIDCPCCGQLVKVYRRPMTATTARTMIVMDRYHQPEGWTHVPTLMREHLADVAHQGGYATLAQHWGLIETMPEAVREDGSNRTGVVAADRCGLPVRLGRAARGEIRPLDNQVLSHDGPRIGIREALGSKFDYDALMESS